MDHSEYGSHGINGETTWKSSLTSTSSEQNPSERKVYRKKKKIQLTEAERKQQMMGMSKAFVNPGNGWAKIDPVYIPDSSSSSDDDTNEVEDDVDLVAQMRERTKRLQTRKAAAGPTPKVSTKTLNVSRDAVTSLKNDVGEALPLTEEQDKGVPEDGLPNSLRAKQSVDGTSMMNNQYNEFMFLNLLPRPLRISVPNTNAAIDQEQRDITFFREAASIAPYEFVSTIVDDRQQQMKEDQQLSLLFVVRRPYGLESRPGLFERISPTKNYRRTAHVSTLAALEVAVVVKPNLPIMLLSGISHIRYRSSSKQKSLVLRSDVGNNGMRDGDGEGSVCRLGMFTSSIDTGDTSSVQSYSLDKIAQQALLIRQHYSASVSSMAMGFKSRPSGGLNSERHAETKKETKTQGVDTKDLISHQNVATDTTELVLKQNA